MDDILDIARESIRRADIVGGAAQRSFEYRMAKYILASALVELGLVSPTQLAVSLGVTVDTLRTWRAAGTGPPFVPIGKGVWYRKEDFQLWCEQRQRNISVREPAPEPAPTGDYDG